MILLHFRGLQMGYENAIQNVSELKSGGNCHVNQMESGNHASQLESLSHDVSQMESVSQIVSASDVSQQENVRHDVSQLGKLSLMGSVSHESQTGSVSLMESVSQQLENVIEQRTKSLNVIFDGLETHHCLSQPHDPYGVQMLQPGYQS